MHIAAQQVQREVHRVAEHEDDHKGEHRKHVHAACLGGHDGHGVEHLADDAAGEHQRHDTRIAQHVAEPARRGVVDRAEGGRDLAEALRVASRAEEQHDNADDEHRERGIVQHAAVDKEHVKGKQHAAEQDDPQRALLPDRAGPVAALDLLHGRDDHAGVQMQQTQHHRAVEHELAVALGAEEMPQSRPGALRIEQVDELIGDVAEKAAGQYAHRRRGDAAVEQQLAEGQRAAARLELFQSHQGCGDHDDAVADVRHHEAVEQNEERRHQRVRVHRAVGRQGIHIGDHVQRVGKLVVFQTDGDLGIIRLRGLLTLPGAVKAGKRTVECLFLLRRDPALHDDDVLGRKRQIGRLRHRKPRLQPVGGKLQLVAPRGLFDDRCAQRFLLASQPCQRGVAAGGALFRGTAHPGKGLGGEVKAAQHLLDLGESVLHADDHHIGGLLVGADLKELRLLGHAADRLAHLVERDLHGERAEQNAAALGAVDVQRQVEWQPGHERFDHGPLAALLGADPLDAVVV